jgi:hypothetical protein
VGLLDVCLLILLATRGRTTPKSIRKVWKYLQIGCKNCVSVVKSYIFVRETREIVCTYSYESNVSLKLLISQWTLLTASNRVLSYFHKALTSEYTLFAAKFIPGRNKENYDCDSMLFSGLRMLHTSPVLVSNAEDHFPN